MEAFNRCYDNKGQYNTIAEFDSGLDKTLHRVSAETEKTFKQWLDRIKQFPDYDKLISRLRNHMMLQQMQHSDQEM